MSKLSGLFHGRGESPGRPEGDGGTPGLGLDDWDGAQRWPEDDGSAPESEPEVDMWIQVNPNQPQPGAGGV